MELLGNIENYIKPTNSPVLATHYDTNNLSHYIIDTNRCTEFWKCICSSKLRNDSCSTTSESDSESGSESESGSDYNSIEDVEILTSPDIRLAEVIKAEQTIPLILDFNMKIGADIGSVATDGIYDNSFIKSLVHECQDEIKNNYVIGNEKKELLCCFIEYPDSVGVDNDGDGIYVFKFKLQFPNLKIYPNDKIYKNILNRIIKSNLSTLLKYQPVNGWDDIIKFENKDHITLFGQEKNSPNLSYVIDEMGTFDSDVSKYYDPHNHNHSVKGYFIPDSDFLKNSFCVPMFLSIEYCVKNARQIASNTQNGVGNGLKFTYRSSDTEEQSLSKRFLTFIRKNRGNVYYYWKDIGKALYNVYEGSKKGLKHWISFTKLSNKFTKKDCENEYDDFEYDNYITIRTLGWYARQDSKLQYEEWMRLQIKKSITNAIEENTDFSVGRVFQKMFWLDYVCADISKKIWYKYEPKEHQWVKIDGGCDIRNEISIAFSEQFKLYKKEFLQAVEGAAGVSNRQRESAEILRKNITKIIYNAGTYNKKNVLVNQIADLMRDKNFMDIKDSNTDVMGIKNGVIECFDKEAIFRPGKPEDYITRSSLAKYDTKMTWKSRNVRKVVRWFKKLYPGKDLYSYVWKIYASFLQGKNLDKKLYFFTGNTNCGKSILKKFFEFILGEYSFTLPSGAISDKKNKSSNGLRPGLALAMESNIAWIIESRDIMSDTDVKLFTGNDALFVRMMGENGGNQTPRFKLLYVCNTVPIIIAGDDAVRERILIIPHLTLYSHNAPKDKEKQKELRTYPRDNNFEKKLRHLRSAGLWIMVQFFKKYKEEGLIMPAEIQAATDEYWDENDIYGSFIRENIIITESERPLTVNSIYNKFSSWIDSNYPSIEIKPDKMMAKKIFMQRLKEKYKIPLDGVNWYGIGLINKHRLIDTSGFK